MGTERLDNERTHKYLLMFWRTDSLSKCWQLATSQNEMALNGEGMGREKRGGGQLADVIHLR